MAVTEAPGPVSASVAREHWKAPTMGEVVKQPLPALNLFDRSLMRVVSAFALPRFATVRGLEYISSEADPFILALNHASRLEAVALPPLLLYHRGGRRVHFMADWNFQMIPGIGLLYRRSGAIVVMRKSARPRFLNLLKPLYAHAEPSHERALAHLKGGRSVGIFPEGTVNRDPERLLRGRLGAARLSLEANVPVVPGGLRVVTDSSRRTQLELELGPSLKPNARAAGPVDRAEVRAWHSVIMSEIARLSGKSWEPFPQERHHGTQ